MERFFFAVVFVFVILYLDEAMSLSTEDWGLNNKQWTEQSNQIKIAIFQLMRNNAKLIFRN